jgi:hypothetical protein
MYASSGAWLPRANCQRDQQWFPMSSTSKSRTLEPARLTLPQLIQARVVEKDSTSYWRPHSSLLYRVMRRRLPATTEHQNEAMVRNMRTHHFWGNSHCGAANRYCTAKNINAARLLWFASMWWMHLSE